jgi:hypothetical protein
VWSSNELIEKSKELNGRKLNYKGELIAAVLNRGEYSWINLNDGSNAIGVWCKSSMLNGVKFAGNYNARGDVLEVNGVFNRACSAHNGELDIHADTVKIVRRGYFVPRAVDATKVNSSMAIFLLIILIVTIFRKRI